MANTSNAHTIDHEAERNQEIADTILRQLGRECLGLLGATEPTVYSDPSGYGVEFGIKGSRTVNRIYITLEPSDTYRLALVQIRGGKFSRTISKII